MEQKSKVVKLPEDYVKQYVVYSLEKDGKKFSRGKKLNTVVLTPDQAKELNSQKGNTLREYVEQKSK